MTSKKPRKKIYLGWKLHGRIVARFAMYWALYNFIVWQCLFGREFLLYESSLFDGRQPITFGEFLQSFASQYGWMIVFAIIVFPMMVWEIVRVTHRIIGPLKRLEGVLQRMADGEIIQHVKFRDGDLIESFEKAFNRYLAALHAANANATAAAAFASETAHPATPPTAMSAHRAPPVPIDSNELLSELHDFWTIAETVTLIPPDDSANRNAVPDHNPPVSLPV